MEKKSHGTVYSNKNIFKKIKNTCYGTKNKVKNFIVKIDKRFISRGVRKCGVVKKRKEKIIKKKKKIIKKKIKNKIKKKLKKVKN